MSLVGQMFGVASATAFIRAGGSGESTRQILAALAKGFGGKTGDGSYVHDLLVSQGGYITSGFDNSSSYYSTLESNVSGLSGPYKIGAGAIIFSYLNFPNANEDDVVNYINKYCSALDVYTNTIHSTSYTKDALEYSVSHASFSNIKQELSGIPRTKTQKAINYNWYDSSPLFANPDLSSMATLIRDTECQYYYVSGELLYNNLPTHFQDCVPYFITVNTPTGAMQVKVYQSAPCVQQDSYVGPVSGIKFMRIFADGPYTSGYFDSQTLEQYVGFEKAILPARDYSSNLVSVYTPQKNADGSYVLLKDNTPIDFAGYVQSGREYGYGHTNFTVEECNGHPAWPLQSMHQGDNRTKLWLHSYTVPNDPTCYQDTGYYNWTGWKLTVFELDKSYEKQYKNIKLNPHNATGGILRRVLNLNPIPYANAMDTGDGCLTVGDLGPYGGPVYVGPPQLNSQSSLPGFAFYQSFENFNFPSSGTGFSFVMRPMITVNDTDFSVSDYDAISGNDPVIHLVSSPNRAKATFNVTFNSTGAASKDDVYKQCFGMGDNFNNSVTSFSGLQSNAGFVYTGFAYYLNGIPVAIGDLLQNNITKIGNAYEKVKYPYGYRSGSHIIGLNTLYGFSETGDTSSGVFSQGESLQYEYFRDGVFGAINSGWTNTFAPVPQDVYDNYWNLETEYNTQQVENFLPRYSEGPYLTYDTKFLYPNAQTLFSAYNSNINGFPKEVEYVITVKEETVREAFKVSGLNGDSLQRHVVRADTNGNILVLETAMAQPFIPNDITYTYKYDFTKNKALYPDEGGFFNYASLGQDLVDENYVPDTSGCPQDGLNSTKYNFSNERFNQGVRITGRMTNRYINTGTGIGQTNLIAFPEPVGDGVYWGYNSKKITGVMKYTAPVFDLNTYSLNPSPELISDMLDNLYGATNFTCSNNGSMVDADINEQIGTPYLQYYGKDPMFYEHVGGRSGSGANVEGGYHSKGIIGDQWLDFTAEQFGNSIAYCSIYPYYYRSPENDKYLSIAALNSSGLTLFTRGLSYFPYYLNWKYAPFTSPTAIGSIGVTTTAREVTKLNYYYDFDLKSGFYPLKSGITTGFYSGLYSQNGMTIGPFDRDVEICLTGKPIFPSGSWLINGEIISQPNRADGCSHPFKGFFVNSGIKLGDYGRYGKLTTIKLIPSGQTANINLSGDGLIGVTGTSILTIRPRTCVGAVNVFGADQGALSGDYGVLNGFKYINNGSESKFQFPMNSNSFSSLAGKTFSATTAANQRVLYPKPPADDFDVVLKPKTDAFGNKTYKSNPTKEYWKARNFNGLYSGYREVTRLYISVDSIKVNMGDIPYQTYKTVIPSGGCTVSGVFAYTGQAESAIVTDGIVLTGATGASSLSGIFEPIYVSDVLQRLPTGIYKLPTGNSTYQPVLLAPSYMKQRKHPFVLNGSDEYISVTPSGKLYNAFLWPAWSDLALLNPEVVYEAAPPEDGNVFTNSYLTFSASKGQPIGTGFNPIENVTYNVVRQYGFLDSVATNPLYNTGKCIFSGATTKVSLNSGDLSGILTTEGVSLTMALNMSNYKK